MSSSRPLRQRFPPRSLPLFFVFAAGALACLAWGPAGEAPGRRPPLAAGLELASALALLGLGAGMAARRRDANGALDLLERDRRLLSDRYANLMDQAGDIILVLDPGGRILEANAQAVAQYGYPPEILRTLSITDLRDPESRAEVSAQLTEALTGNTIRFETQHRRADGSLFPVEVSSRYVQAGAAVLSFIRDISARKAQERELRRMTRLNAALGQVNQSIVWSVDRQALLDRICAVMVESGGFKMAWFGWEDPETHRISVVARQGDARGMLDRVVVRSDGTAEGLGAVGTAMRQGTPCVINDFLDQPASLPWREELEDSGFAAVAAFPVRQAGEIRGAFAVYAGEKDFFGAQEIVLLEEAAMDVSFALDHLEGEARRQAAEEALKESERFLREAQAAGGVGTYVWLIQEDRWHGSPFLERIFGVDAEHPRNLEGWSSLVAPDHRAELDAYVAGIIARRERFDHQYPIIRPVDGARRWLHGRGEFRWDGEGRLLALTGVIQDITEVREQTRQLERLTQMYAALSQVNQAIVWSSDRQALLDKICEVMVEFGRFSMAWIGWNDPAAGGVRVLARHGDDLGCLEVDLVLDEDSPLGRGPAGMAVRSGRACIGNAPPLDAGSVPLREADPCRGYAASAAFPIRQGGEVRGVLTVHSREKDFFGPHEAALLEEAAGDVSFALDHLEGERRRIAAEEAIRKTSVAVEQSPLLVIITDPAGAIEYVNPRFTEVTGYSREEALGRNPRILKSPATPPEVHRRLWAALSRGEVWKGELEDLKKGGEPFLVRTTIAPVKNAAGGTLNYVAMQEDITALRRAEEERSGMEAQLQQAQKLESLGSLAGGVAHDMNNVMGAILSLAATLQEKADPQGPDFRSLETIQNACLRGRGVVKSLLYFARKDLQVEASIDLNALVREIAQLLNHTTLKRIELRMDLQDSLGRLRGDAGALGHALMNLCVNSLDAMPGTGVLRIQTSAEPGGGLEVRVADTGQGMRPEVLQRAMEPFFTTKPLGKGTGLGLSMAYGTLKAHEGTLELRSEPGKGTEAILHFPASRVEPWPSGAEAGSFGGAEAAPGLRILLVDDDELIQVSVAALLEMLGHEALVAPGGQAALDLLRAGQPMDLVILDMNMPGMTGAEALPAIQALRPGLPVVMATGYSDEDIAPLIARHPNVSSIFKPFTLKELKRKIGECAPRRAVP